MKNLEQYIQQGFSFQFDEGVVQGRNCLTIRYKKKQESFPIFSYPNVKGKPIEFLVAVIQLPYNEKRVKEICDEFLNRKGI